MLSKAVVCLVALALTATVSGMATPGQHVARSHRALAARKMSPVVDVPLKKRDNSGRCKPRTTTTTSSSTTQKTTTTSSVVNAAPDPTTTTKAPPPPPPPSSTHSSTKTTSSQPPAKTQSSGGDVQYGYATYYYVADGNQVACGGYYQDSDVLVAISIDLFNSMGGNSAVCGRTITVEYNGKSIVVPVLDECEACTQDPVHIDLSVGAISQFDSNYVNDGQLNNIKWWFN